VKRPISLLFAGPKPPSGMRSAVWRRRRTGRRPRQSRPQRFKKRRRDASQPMPGVGKASIERKRGVVVVLRSRKRKDPSQKIKAGRTPRKETSTCAKSQRKDLDRWGDDEGRKKKVAGRQRSATGSSCRADRRGREGTQGGRTREEREENITVKPTIRLKRRKRAREKKSVM